jgi:hypothetical protein
MYTREQFVRQGLAMALLSCKIATERKKGKDTWEDEQEFYQGSNVLQLCCNSWTGLEGSMYMNEWSKETWEAFEKRGRELKEEYITSSMEAYNSGFERGKELFHSNKYQALVRIIASGSLRAAKAQKELLELVGGC